MHNNEQDACSAHMRAASTANGERTALERPRVE